MTHDPQRIKGAASDWLAASYRAQDMADKLRPHVHPDDGGDELACAVAALCLEVRALTNAVLHACRP